MNGNLSLKTKSLVQAFFYGCFVLLAIIFVCQLFGVPVGRGSIYSIVTVLVLELIITFNLVIINKSIVESNGGFNKNIFSIYNLLLLWFVQVLTPILIISILGRHTFFSSVKFYYSNYIQFINEMSQYTTKTLACICVFIICHMINLYLTKNINKLYFSNNVCKFFKKRTYLLSVIILIPLLFLTVNYVPVFYQNEIGVSVTFGCFLFIIQNIIGNLKLQKKINFIKSANIKKILILLNLMLINIGVSIYASITISSISPGIVTSVLIATIGIISLYLLSREKFFGSIVNYNANYFSIGLLMTVGLLQIFGIKIQIIVVLLLLVIIQFKQISKLN